LHVDKLMIELARTVRFCVNLADSSRSAPLSVGRHNTFAGWPAMHGLGAFYELHVTCRGQPDPVTGYLMNISAIDRAVRDHALPIVDAAVRQAPATAPGHVVARALAALQPALSCSVASIRWSLTPYYSIAMNADATDRVLMSQQFEFSAAHRLNVDSLGHEENRRIFGKCNNHNGHGHNYCIEPTVSVPLDASGNGLTLALLERIVDETIIRRFDHKHLNLDTAEFANLNPSVEHIAKVCHGLLFEPIFRAGGRLERVTVWETRKTSCTYPAR
jgi:6-pyruvoyltetrahydropterin/6-carboxytetrahydropterin synthase